jgi:arylamine N-acetyltransferase
MNTEAYLKRINYTGSLVPNRSTLRSLQVAHLLNVPFENLSIHSGEPIVLDDDALFRKIVENRRGGFCYELNGLFAALLRGLGFDVSMLAAEVAKDGGGFSPNFEHMALMVTLAEPWLVDVGFGDSFWSPCVSMIAAYKNRELVPIKSFPKVNNSFSPNASSVKKRNHNIASRLNHTSILTTKKGVCINKLQPTHTSRRVVSVLAQLKMAASH